MMMGAKKESMEMRKMIWERRKNSGSAEDCPEIFLQSLERYTRISLGSLWMSECVYESNMYVCMCLCVRLYCMSLRGLWAQQSLNSGVDVSSGSNEGLQVGLAVNEAHGVKLVQLGLEPHLRGLGLKRQGNKGNFKSFVWHLWSI